MIKYSIHKDWVGFAVEIENSATNIISVKRGFLSIEEKLCKTVEIEAENIDEAMEKAGEMYKNSEIVLDSNDMGTDAEMMAEEVGGGESTDWNTF